MHLESYQPRLQRYQKFINKQFIDSLLWNKDYSIENIREDLKKKISSGQIKKIIFTGMGCSAIVSDLIKGFFADQKNSTYVDVINDYDLDILVDKADLMDEKTLIIVSSYSGHSQEPIHFYNKIKNLTPNIVFLTSGGKLADIATKDDISIIYWKLRNPDREYPLFHVTQYFSILLDAFFELKILKSNFQDVLKETTDYLKNEFTLEKIEQANKLAQKLRDREIVFIASPKWYVSLLKLADMHFNEMSMASAHRNFFHEFTHSEIAAFSHPKQKMAIVLFRDIGDDQYINDKMDKFIKIITNPATQNENIELLEIVLNQQNFVSKLFSTLLFLNHMAYFLGLYYNTPSRELISTAAGNPWYSQEIIQSELKEKTAENFT